MSAVESVPLLLSVKRLDASKAKRRYYDADSKGISFIWGESCCGQKKNGPQTAPPLVCSDEFLSLVGNMGWEPKVVRVPQVFEASPEGTKLFQPKCVAATCNAVATASHNEAEAGNFPLLIGGDHCLAMGTIMASKKRHPNLCVIWFDAHADVNTEDTSPSGNMHGMPVAALLGLEPMKRAPGFDAGQFTCLKPGDIGWVGLRDVDEGEYDTLKLLGIETAYHMPDLDRLGIEAQVNIILDQINPARDRPIHLSFDVDGMDPIDAPSTGTAVPGGVRIHEAIQMVRMLRETGLLVSMDVVEVNPSLGDARDVDITVHNARWIIAEGLGLNVAAETR